MAAPLKPWEQPGVNCNTSNYSASLPTNSNQFIIGPGQSIPSSVAPPPAARSLNPPPLPPRPTSTYANFNQYGNSPYAGYSAGYGGNPMFSNPYSNMSYGGYQRYGYSNFSPYGNAGAMVPNSFVQMAEENSRPAFQSIEAIVHAVGSVASMLDSTYNALYSSFRAVLGVAHHFGQMKSQFTQVLSALAIIRGLRWLYRKVLYMLGLRSVNPMDDEIWSNISKSLNDANLPDGNLKRKSNWPIIMFFAVVFGGPWLIWKLLMSMSGTSETETKTWITGEGPHFTGVTLYGFRGESQNELSFEARQTLRIAPKELQPRIRGWLLASVDGKTSGLIPGNYVQICIPQPTTLQPVNSAQNVPLILNDSTNESDDTAKENLEPEPSLEL